MKKIIAILILMLLIPVVSAQDEEQLAGITPDSIFYGLDVFFDNIKVAMTPTILGKVTARLEIVEERAAEIEEMANENKTTEANKAQLELEKQMKKFEGSVEKIKKKDAPELKEHIQTHVKRLEIWKQRLENYDIPDYADAMAEAIVLLETTENIIVNIPEDLGPDSTFIMSSICKEAGATTIAECNEMIASGALTATVGRLPENHSDPHGCSGFWADFKTKTKWCCNDSDGTYSPEWIENILSDYDEHVSNVLGSSPHMLNYYHRAGTVEYKIINLETGEIEQGIETDSCDGDTLIEWFCPRSLNMVTRNERYSEEYECPYGCEDGACINCNLDSICDQNEDCSCSDCEGKNNGCRHSYFVCQDGECVKGDFKGECTDSDDGMDYFVKGSVTGKSQTTNFTQFSTDSCVDDSRLVEFFCGDNNEVNIEMYSCPNGCEDGACMKGEVPYNNS